MQRLDSLRMRLAETGRRLLEVNEARPDGKHLAEPCGGRPIKSGPDGKPMRCYAISAIGMGGVVVTPGLARGPVGQRRSPPAARTG